MKHATLVKIGEAKATLSKRYGNYYSKPVGERVLLAMAYLADDIKVRESGGNNRGEWVEAALDTVGIDGPASWCAAAISLACEIGIYTGGPKDGRGRVYNWWKWGNASGRDSDVPARRSLCVRLNADTTGHIGIVVRSGLGMVYSIEGNTSSGNSGSQRDGDGLHRRVRLKSFWNKGFIVL